MVIMYEFGYLYGLQYIYVCVWNGNSIVIDGCVGLIEGSCVLFGNFLEGGIIMFYCYFQSVGINFSWGFGIQFGNVIWN